MNNKPEGPMVQPSPALAALAMRERAAKACDGFCNECARSIRALPTTFTDAELLAASMKLPEVRALVDAAKAINKRCLSGDFYSDYDGDMQILSTMHAALTPFTKGAS